MKIQVLCSDPRHPVNAYLEAWQARHAATHEIRLLRRVAELDDGDFLFLVSCSEIVPGTVRARFTHVLVLHASDLPRGRGWSPHIWALIEGADSLTLSLLEAADPVDSGRIWSKRHFPVPRDALWDEINDRLFQAEIELLDEAIGQPPPAAPQAQDPDITPSYYRRRTPEDSRIDPERSLAEQFDRIRVCDPVRFPAFFELRGHRYKILLEKIDDVCEPLRD